MNNKGFTLVELIVVVAILAIITVVVAPQYLEYVEKARIGTDENALGEIAHIVEISYVELQADNKADNDSLASMNVAISGGAVQTYAKNDLTDLVKEVMPEGQYTFKSKEYKNGTATIEIDTATGAVKIDSATGLPFKWSGTK